MEKTSIALVLKSHFFVPYWLLLMNETSVNYILYWCVAANISVWLREQLKVHFHIYRHTETHAQTQRSQRSGSEASSVLVSDEAMGREFTAEDSSPHSECNFSLAQHA